MTDKVYVDDAGRSGCPIALRIDEDGDIEISGYPDDDMWIKPQALVAALKQLGVLPDDAEKPRERRIEPSDRVRESWRRAAAEDAPDRPEIEQHAYRRRLEAQRARERAAKMAGPRFFRDRDGDVWRSLADGRLTMHRMRSGQVVGMTDPRALAYVQNAYGPLTEVADPAPRPSWSAANPAIGDRLTARYVEHLRQQAQQDIKRSVWRNF